MEDKELLPCPFCGGEAKLWSHHYAEEDLTLWQVRCNRDFLRKKCYMNDSFVTFGTEEEAIEAWNTRSLTFPDEVQEAQHHLCELERITGEAWRPERTCNAVFNGTNRGYEPRLYCSECRTELVGKFCHECGAKVVE